MVNIFGNEAVRGKKGDRGPSGPRGLPGKQGEKGDSGSIEDSCTWMGNTVLKNLELYDDKGCFFIDDPATDVEQSKEGEITTWVSRTFEKNNLEAERTAKHLTKKLPNNRYGIVFDGKSRYYSEKLGLLQVSGGNCIGFLCITFRTMSDAKDQVLVSNFQYSDMPYREISLSGIEKKIFITSYNQEGKPKHISIDHDAKQWTTLYIEYNGYTSKPSDYTYIIKGADSTISSGHFTLDSDDYAAFGLAVGSRFSNDGFFTGEISSLEIYHVSNTLKKFPKCLQNLVIDNHIMKDKEDNPPSSKKSRVK